MERAQLEALVQRLYAGMEGNRVIVEEADGAGRPLRMFDEPLVGIGSAADPLFDEYKKPEAVGPWHRSPKEWLAEAQTVIKSVVVVHSCTQHVTQRSEEQSGMPRRAVA